MRFGLCCEPERIDEVAALGYDFLECNFTNLQSMPDADFESIVAKVRRASIDVEASNCLLPPSLKIVGPCVAIPALTSYLEKGFARAEQVGMRIVVFGSGGARNIPVGFDAKQAWHQIFSFLRLASDIAARYQIEIVIEPVRRKESNLLNYVSEATAVSSLLDLPNVRVLGDSFHMIIGHEPYAALAMAGDLLRHVHTSETLNDAQGRVMPTDVCKDELQALISTLVTMGYSQRVSVEAPIQNLQEEGAKALALLRACL